MAEASPDKTEPFKNFLGGTQPLCDFCLSINPVWDYDCEAFVIMDMERGKMTTTHMNPPWAACERCSSLIERDDKAGLIEQVVRANCEDRGLPRDELTVAEETLLVNNFWRRRIGPRVRATD